MSAIDDEDDAAGGDAENALGPAWGGARRGEGVPVPVEFEHVNDLGPAVEVVEELPGIQLLPNFGTPLVHVLVRYRDGFAFRVQAMLASHRKDVHVWRWDEVTTIETNRWIQYPNARNVRERHEYTLTKTNGERVMLDDSLTTIGVIGHVKRAVFELLEPPLVERYETGETVAFGPVEVHRKNGLHMEGKLHAWNAIQNVQVDDGRFKIALQGERHEVRASLIPNIEMLCKLIGLELNSAKLAYV